MRRAALALATLAALAAGARGDGVGNITVAVGDTVTREVGFAQGAQCDDPSIAYAEMRDHTAESNTFAVTGVKVGDTACRAGTVPNRPMQLFYVHVVEKKAARHASAR